MTFFVNIPVDFSRMPVWAPTWNDGYSAMGFNPIYQYRNSCLPKMLVKNAKNREQLEFVSLEDIAPQDHFLRKIDAAIDFKLKRIFT